MPTTMAVGTTEDAERTEIAEGVEGAEGAESGESAHPTGNQTSIPIYTPAKYAISALPLYLASPTSSSSTLNSLFSQATSTGCSSMAYDLSKTAILTGQHTSTQEHPQDHIKNDWQENKQEKTQESTQELSLRHENTIATCQPAEEALFIRHLTQNKKLHQDFNSGFSSHILSLLASIGEDETIDKMIRGYSKSIKSGGSKRLFYTHGKDETDNVTQTHEPDITFSIKGGGILSPTLVFELACAQMSKDVEKLADYYIMGSEGDINTVVSIDISYGGLSKRATLSVWKAKWDFKDKVAHLLADKVIDAQEFRDEDGNVSQNSLGLELTLRDFANEATFHDVSLLTQPITITAQELCKLLAEAEIQEVTEKSRQGNLVVMLKKKETTIVEHFREKKPEDEIGEENEHNIKGQEKEWRGEGGMSVPRRSNRQVEQAFEEVDSAITRDTAE